MRRCAGMLACICICLLVACPSHAMGQFFSFRNFYVGKPAADFTLPIAGKGEATMSEYRNGKGAIIFFWATWCPHCRTALDDLSKRAVELEERGIKIIAVNIEETESAVKSYASWHNITLDIFLDTNSSLVGPYGIVAVPAFYLVGSDGIVQAVENSLSSIMSKLYKIGR